MYDCRLPGYLYTVGNDFIFYTMLLEMYISV